MKHDNLGKGNVQLLINPLQPCVNGGNCSDASWDDSHITSASFADLQDATEYELKLHECATQKLVFKTLSQSHQDINLLLHILD